MKVERRILVLDAIIGHFVICSSPAEEARKSSRLNVSVGLEDTSRYIRH